MAEILHQLIGSFSHYLQGSINRSTAETELTGRMTFVASARMQEAL